MKLLFLVLLINISFVGYSQHPDSTKYTLDTVTYKKVQGAYHYFRYEKRVRPRKLHLAMDDPYYSKKSYQTHRVNATFNVLIIVSSASLMGYQFYNMWNDLEVKKDYIYVAAGIVGIGIPINLVFDRMMFNQVRGNNRNIQKEFRRIH